MHRDIIQGDGSWRFKRLDKQAIAALHALSVVPNPAVGVRGSDATVCDSRIEQYLRDHRLIEDAGSSDLVPMKSGRSFVRRQPVRLTKQGWVAVIHYVGPDKRPEGHHIIATILEQGPGERTLVRMPNKAELLFTGSEAASRWIGRGTEDLSEPQVGDVVSLHICPEPDGPYLDLFWRPACPLCKTPDSVILQGDTAPMCDACHDKAVANGQP